MATGIIRGQDVTDSQLLDRFLTARDEAAFTSIVQRHGPMVMGVCQRVLRDLDEAEDVFQATFLVLARKAGSISKPDLLGNWLYGVAHRTSLEARSKAMRRRAIERRVMDAPPIEPTPEVVWQELREVLDEEVSRLPDKFRAPFVLCYLEGRTNDEAASHLGCPKGTVLSRLATARERLRARLTRRGIVLSTGLLAMLLTDKATAAVSSSLTISTINASVKLAAGQTLTGVVSGKVAALTEGVLKAMYVTKLKVGVASALAVVLLGLGTVMLAQTANQGQENANADRELIQGTWNLVSGKDGGELAQKIEGSKMVITQQTLVLTLPDGKKLEWTYQMDPSRQPKWIDVTDTKANRTMMGLYSLKANELKIVLDEGGETGRPTDFVSEQNPPNDLLFVLKREPKK
jgi:RNA polymerase sigma factor (sigma-70 family)